MREHLHRYGAPAIVSIGEDATRVIGRVEYDNETDRCVGFVLPLDGNSLPMVDSFLAVSFTTIENMFRQNSVAKYAYVYMAQPLCNNVPPFCLACLGTNNKFSAENVMARWRYISEECMKRNILVLSFGGDGDTRLMKCMKVATSLMTSQCKPLSSNIPSNKLVSTPVIPQSWLGWFHTTPREIAFVQDTVHLAVKLKSRLLKPQIILPMGDVTATGRHVQALMTTFQKSKHGLRAKDVDHKDRQNFQAVMNITSASHLLSEIPGANGTKCYVELIKCMIDGYLDKDLAPLCRIEKLWYVVFFMRYWRRWLLLHSKYTLRDNFITSNAYLCIELNAHALIVYLMVIRDQVNNFDDGCFLPWLLGSQCCESTFRTARSMSSIFSTMINFSLLDLLRRLHRLHIQLALQAENSEDIVFPRLTKHQRKNIHPKFSLSDLSNDKIFKSVQRAQVKAKLMVEELGMASLFKKHSMWSSKVTLIGIDGGKENSTDDTNSDDDSDAESSDEAEEILKPQDSFEEEVCTDEAVKISDDLKTTVANDLVDRNLQQKLQHRQKLAIKRLPSSALPVYQYVETMEVKQTSLKQKCQNQFTSFVEVQTRSGKPVLIRKTTALWLLQEGERISTDRLFRVRHIQPYSSTSSSSINVKPVTVIDDSINSKPDCTPPSSSLSDAVVIDDGDVTADFSRPWLRIGSITLYDKDKLTIMKGNWLWGTHLTALQFLLKAKFTQLNGLEDTAMVLRKGNTVIPGSIQILHVDGNHWLTISTLDSSSSNEVTVYDSLHFTLSKDTEELLAKLMKSPESQLMVKLGNTNKQAGFDDCGLFAAAYCTSLAHGQNPSSFVYDQAAMRTHLVRCLETQKVEPFPIVRQRRTGTTRLTIIDIFLLL